MLERWDVVERRTFLKLIGMSAAATVFSPYVAAEAVAPQEVLFPIVDVVEKNLVKFGAMFKLGGKNMPAETIANGIEALVRDISFSLWKVKHVPVSIGGELPFTMIYKSLGSSGTVDPADQTSTLAVVCYAYEDRVVWAREYFAPSLLDLKSAEGILSRGELLTLAGSNAKARFAKDMLPLVKYPFRTVDTLPSWMRTIPRNYGTKIKIAKARGFGSRPLD